MATRYVDAVDSDDRCRRGTGSRLRRPRWQTTDADLVPLVGGRSDHCIEDDDESSVEWIGSSPVDCGSSSAVPAAEDCRRCNGAHIAAGEQRHDDTDMLPLDALELPLWRREAPTGEQSIGLCPAASATAAAEQQLQSAVHPTQPSADGCEQLRTDWSALRPPASLLPPPPLYAGPSSLASTQQLSGGESEDRLFEPPPPYTATQPRFTRCKVCRKLINIENKQHLLVVKCLACSEVTPLREPPIGKRYLRCSCNCLMMVDSRAVRVTCARPSCQRIIIIQQQQNGASTAASRPRGRIAARCAHCRLTFQYDVRGKKVIRCPHCRKVSVVDQRYKLRMAGVFAFFGVALLLAAIAACGVAVDNENGSWGMFSFLAASILVSLVFLQRTYYYCRLQVSRACRPPDIAGGP